MTTRVLPAMKVQLRRAALLLLPGLLANLMIASSWADSALSQIDALSPAEQYRQLNLAVMVSSGAGPQLLDYLQARNPAPGDAVQSVALPVLDIDDFQTPLNRIVNPGEMLANAARYMRSAQSHDAAIMQRMSEVAEHHADEVSAVDLIQLAEDAIIIRTSLAGSIGYASADAGAELAGQLTAFEDETVRLRNQMEYWRFDRELAVITENAMKDTGGRMDAYQRMLEEGPEADGFQHHLNAIEKIYKETRKKTRLKKPDTVNDKLIEEQGRVKH